MDYKFIVDFQTELQKYRNERRLSYVEQQEGLVANFLDEVKEFARATTTENMAEEVCDLAIYILNSFPIHVRSMVTHNNSMLHKSSVKDIMLYFLAEYVTIDMELKTDIDESIHLNLLDIIFCAIEDLGYDYKLALNEKLKVINSRKGYYNVDLKKFIKTDSGSYTADFSKCKLKK